MAMVRVLDGPYNIKKIMILLIQNLFWQGLVL